MIRARRWDRLWFLWLTAVFVILPALAWLHHAHSMVTEGRWVALVLGALVFPIGVLHGIALWLGF